MQRIIIILVITLVCSGNLALAQLQTPSEFFPHEWGTHFTPHHLLVDYFEHVAENSNYVQLSEFGRTNEQRPLMLAVVSTPENLARLDEIRENNLRRTGLLAGEATDENVAIVWLGFSVHGNEPAGSEAVPRVLYELVDPDNADTKTWLENTIVLIEPSVNPDGYTRYTDWYRRAANEVNNPDPEARSHDEPWPGGRTNHYYFDLNRDWAWQTQVESQQRLEVYHQWMPHVAADLHEQGLNNPYYFAPAAQPYHKYITPWQRTFQDEIGRNHAKYFDENGWLYFTKEVFDLLYPSYGDTYPTYNGAIGMTYEQGGGSRAGRGVITETGDTLTLMDRVMHHKTTALSTVEIASKNAKRLIENFDDFFTKSRNAEIGNYKTFVIKGDNEASRLRALIHLLDKNKIEYGRAEKAGSLRAFDYQTGEQKSIEVEPDDLIVSAFQPKSVLAQILLEPQPELVDSLTYDITAWSLPYAYGLEAYASKDRFEAGAGYEFENYSNNLRSVRNPYAFVARWKSMDNARFLAEILRRGVKVRYATEPFGIDGEAYDRGTLVITRADNRKLANFEAIVADAALQTRQDIRAVRTGYMDSGKDFGSSDYIFIKEPKVAVLGGERTFSNSFGQVWYYFEQDLQYPLTVIPANDFSRTDLDDYNLLILPEGFYTVNANTLEKLNDWMRGGGRLIAIGYALRSLQGRNGFSLNRKADDDNDSKAEEEADTRFASYGGQSRRRISEDIPGAIFKLRMDATHPLAFGLGEHYFTLKRGATAYAPSDDFWNVGTIGEAPMYQGFVGSKALEEVKNSVVFAVEDEGRGSITYLVDNPLFRSFWENGKFLFSNAVFLVGQ